MSYFNCHSHTMYSNIRLLDCINRPKDLIDTAIKLGLKGIAITDHECVSAAIEVNQYAKKLRETNPDFTVALGNEIYLINERGNGQKYFHFILIAKDAIGHKALRELSSTAWYNSYTDRGMERVPTTKKELSTIMSKYRGHVIATTACIGGELSSNALLMAEASAAGAERDAMVYYNNMLDFLNYCVGVFGDDFYIECAPSTAKDQMMVNQALYKVASDTGIKMVVGTDAHYLRPEDRPVHKAYLNSKGGEREVDSFYEFAYLMTAEEVSKYLAPCFPNGIKDVETIFRNSEELRQKINFYSLERKQSIPKVEVKNYPQEFDIQPASDYTKYPTLCALRKSDNIQERYWVHECFNGLREKGLWKEEYLNRLEIEADVIKFIGNKLDDCLFAYFNTFKHYIDLFWECGSIVGPGRGSATGFLSNYLLGITQLDPIRWNLPYWRFLNKERAELPDIDIDLAPSKRPNIFKAIRKERGEFGLIQVGTFGTEGTKSAILTACRGYRSEDFPDGIDVDEAQYMSSLIPQERGFLWPINDVVHGNPEKDRTPVHAFIREVEQYPGLLDIIVAIEGLINKRSSHASGVILYDEDPFETASFMRTPSGDLITCYDLHKAEAAGDTKYDFLVTEISDKIITCLELLQKDGLIPKMSLRECYEKYLHPEILDTSNPVIWDHLAAGDILDVFQFSTGVGLAIAKRLKPTNPLEMTAANAMMRLMSEKGKESQQDRYVRIKSQGIEAFDAEMKRNNLPQSMIDALHKHCDKYYGCCAIQEQMMEILMDSDIACFTLKEANDARKIVAKKQMDRIPELKGKVYDVMDKHLADYVWEVAVAPQLGYAFSMNHSLPYSFVGIQSIELATRWDPIYWDTACLIVNSGSLEEGESDDEELDDDGKKKNSSTDYGKIAKAMGDIMSRGIKISLVDINKSGFGFEPDAANNQIMYGLKSMLNVGDELIQDIIAKRPYASPKDFLKKVNPKKPAMISLIKGGAFDNMMERKLCMGWYLWETCDKKSRLTLQNMPSLIKYNLLPTDTEEQVLARRVYEFNRYLKAVCLNKAKTRYILDARAMDFLCEIGQDTLMSTSSDSKAFLDPKTWDKVYQKWMDVFRDWINANKESILYELNAIIFKEDWDKYAKGTISAWEMEALCFYYHEHELEKANTYRYGLVDFFKLPEAPVVDKSFERGGKTINMFKLSKICGTCIAKNKTKSTVTLLTTSGVVNVKFRKEYFALFDKQISAVGADGAKHIVEKSWFNRGSMIIVQGMRSGDDFISKKYASTGGHQLYKIDAILPDGELSLKDSRYQGGIEEDA